MFVLNALAFLVMFVIFVPIRLVSRLSEKLIEKPRTGGWQTGLGDQMQLAFANGAALRQAQLFTAYPEPAFRMTQLLQLFGMR